MDELTEEKKRYLDSFEKLKSRIEIMPDVTVFNNDIFNNDILNSRAIYDSILLPRVSNSNFTSYKIIKDLDFGVPILHKMISDTIRSKTIKERAHYILKNVNDAIDILKTLDVSPIISPLDSTMDITSCFLDHLRNNIRFILEGPPGANTHIINKERAKEWIARQHSEERKRLARIIINNIRYISHSELLHMINITIDKLLKHINLSIPVIFIVGNPKKSNYYISLLFAYFWLNRGLRLDGVFSKIYTNGFPGKVNLLDIDDMSYTGTQTTNVFKAIGQKFINTAVPNLTKISKELEFLITYFPNFIGDYILIKTGYRLYVIRIFASSQSITEFKNITTYRLPFFIVYGELIPSLKQTLEMTNFLKVSALFNPIAETMIYFDHKVADSVSTFLLPISYGIIPGKKLMKNILDNRSNAYTPELMRNLNITDNIKLSTYPFIDGCFNNGRIISNNLGEMNRNDNRCPYAWYKSITYTSDECPIHSEKRIHSERIHPSHKNSSHKNSSHKNNSHKNNSHTTRKRRTSL